MDILTREITYKKVRGVNVDFSTRKIIIKNGRGKEVDFLTMEITSEKVCGNDMDFLTSEITLKKVLGNDVGFLIQEVTSKKYVEMTWKFVQVWSSMYRDDIDVEWTWIEPGVPVKFTHPFSFIWPLFSQNASRLLLPKGL